MKIQQRLVAMLAAVLITSGCFPMPVVEADQDIAQQEDTQTPDTETTGQEATQMPDTEPTGQETPQTPDTESTGQEVPQTPDTEPAGQEVPQTPDTEPTGQEVPQTPDTAASGQESPETSGEDEMLSSDTASAPAEEMMLFMTEDVTGIQQQELDAPVEDGEDYPIPDEPPAFQVRIKPSVMLYVVGTFTDITLDTVHIYPLYSLDGENWQRVDDDDEWDLDYLGTEDETELTALQNQILGLEKIREPWKSYVEGEIDRIYIKLQIIRKNGCSYDSVPAVIDRALLSVPEGMTCVARFANGVCVQEPIVDEPWRFREFGRCQLSVPADATAEEISALLPDTLPVEVQCMSGGIPYGTVVIDCPVTWKPLSVTSLSAGGIITIPDAAEEIQVPAGIRIKTPFGIYDLDQPLGIVAKSDRLGEYCNEVELVLNVCEGDSSPNGVLKEDGDGLKISLYSKVAGASSIRAYVLTEGESEWTEIPGLSLLKELGSQPSTTNSGYALVLRKDQEPYRSYREATAAGMETTPFFVGLKIEGGIYDGRQLVLAWPDVYERLPDLPKISGIEGNEGNVGADNKDDSTESGQRPDLPVTPGSEPEELQPDPPSASDDNRQELQSTPADTPETAPAMPADQSSSSMEMEEHSAPQVPEDAGSGQRPDLPQITQDTADVSSVEPHSIADEKYIDGNESDGNAPGGNEPDGNDTGADEPDRTVPIEAGAATDTKSDDLMLSDKETANMQVVKEHTAETASSMPLLPAATVAAAGGCIAAAVSKAAGYSLFGRIAGIIRHVLHR